MSSEVPLLGRKSYRCPYCGVLASQYWHKVYSQFAGENIQKKEVGDGKPAFSAQWPQLPGAFEVDNLALAACHNCAKITVWVGSKLLLPQARTAPAANPDLPADVLSDYEEASAIADQSPRGAAALLRLCIQKLCIHLGQPGNNINSDIKALVQSGLDPRVQKALDVVRVIGNNAVHPGEIDADDRETAETLFQLVNLIADKMISEPKHLDDVYNSLPTGVLEAIDKRDGKVPPAASDKTV
ncbi:DUF4145 domain-containing protein [Sinorhizobium meliloti]|uniref:DUF4145 domain-containing protein n=1 Tax=Rhizobium meliloti TaxID=382 RepID=UPI003F17A69A